MSVKISHSRGFTLVELMISIGIMGILMTMSMMPFGSYMARDALRQEKNEIGQRWILAHKSVRNGIQFERDDVSTTSADEGKHASILFEFKKDSDTIDSYLIPYDKDTLFTSFGDIKNTFSDPSNKKLFKKIELDKKIEVLEFKKSDGSAINEDEMYYLITPPYGVGSFFYGSETSDDIIVTIGYQGSTPTNGKQKDIYLRPYLR